MNDKDDKYTEIDKESLRVWRGDGMVVSILMEWWVNCGLKDCQRWLGEDLQRQKDNF